MTIPVICDRCRVAGTAGTGDFSHFGDLLDFEPVEVRYRVNGWDPDAQRAFIALLATTGSKRRAAIAIGRNAFGIDQLLKRPDADSFRAAYDRAMAIAKQNGAMKLATGVADAAARNAMLTPPSRLRDLPSPLSGRGRSHEVAEGEGAWSKDAALAEAEHESLTLSLMRQYLIKLQQEREARLAGQVVAADFTLRQVTFLEVALDLALDNQGIDPWTWLANLRRDGHDLVEIAQTPFSRFLDEVRRSAWESEFPDLHRPAPTAEELLRHRGGYSLEPVEFTTPKTPRDHQQQMAEYAERHRKAAEEQVEWEASQLEPHAGD